MQIADFDYHLPSDLIARYPLPERSASRLMCLNARDGAITHNTFNYLLDFLSPNDLLVCNNSKVIPARLFGKKVTGGHVEVLVERVLDNKRILAHLRVSKKPKSGSELIFSDNIRFKVLGRKNDLFELNYHGNESILEIIEVIGQIPIPPYFERAAEALDKERYQTIYAKTKGSVAAPTAGLHFDEALLQKIREKGVDIDFVTLHVGAGTFAPVRVADITQHQMHAEVVHVSAELCEKIKNTKARGGRVVAVGTTTVRSLETACLTGELKPFTGETDIFIYPSKTLRCVDALVTNFHLPCSTLLMLVCALGGYENVMAAYREAVAQKYRFFSYGDAMLVC